MAFYNSANCILWRRKLANYIYPVVYVIGRLCGIKREDLEEEYINFSNRLTVQQHYQFPPEKIMILVPHCLQQDACKHKITRHLENCQQCGGCAIGSLKALQQKYHCQLQVATGGTLARQLVKQFRPEAIVAVACERDLSSGIMDVFPMPVLGVLNQRPFGPCFNTNVDLGKVEAAITIFMGGVHV